VIEMAIPRKGTEEWYKFVEESNTRLRSQLLAQTPKATNETSRDWLRRVSSEYYKKKNKGLGIP
jgi:hypothetical protein